jgi:hypothetical protein
VLCESQPPLASGRAPSGHGTKAADVPRLNTPRLSRSPSVLPPPTAPRAPARKHTQLINPRVLLLCNTKTEDSIAFRFDNRFVDVSAPFTPPFSSPTHRAATVTD